MRKSFVTLAAALCISGTAQAQLFPTYNGGYWRSMSGTSDNQALPECVAGTTGGGVGFFVKWFADDPDHVLVHLFDAEWHGRLDGATPKVRIQVDHRPPWEGLAKGGSGVLELPFDNATFLEELRQGREFVVTFPDLSEPAWRGSLSGSNGAIAEMVKCMATMSAAYGGGTLGAPAAQERPQGGIKPRYL